MENINENENEYAKNYHCLMKLYNFQESMRKYQIKQNESTNFYLINPKSLLNYNEYCDNKELESFILNNTKKNGVVKSKKMSIDNLPIIKQKSNDEYPYKEIKMIFKIKYRKKELELSCYNKIIIVNEEIKNLMNNITHFVKENIIFINDYIAIPLEINILEIFKYENNKRICYPRYIMIFEDKLYTDRAIEELNKEGLFNYLYKKNIKGHIDHKVLYDDKGKKLGEIINIFDKFKEVNKKEKQRIKEENLINNKKLENKIIEEKEENYEDEKFSNFDELKEENKYNDFNNNNKNNNNSIPKEEIVQENENLKEKSFENNYEEEFKDSKNVPQGEFEEKSENEKNNNNIQNSKDENIINKEIQSDNDEAEKEILQQLEGEHKNNNIKEDEIKSEINNNINNNIKEETIDKINNGIEIKKEESEDKINKEENKNEQKEEEYNEEFNQIKEGNSLTEGQKINSKEENEKEINIKDEKEINYNENEELKDAKHLLKLEKKLQYLEQLEKEEKEENKNNEEKSTKENKKQIIKEEEKINNEDKNKNHESIILEDEDINDEIKIKEDSILKEEEKIKQEQALKLEQEKEQEKNIINNIQQKLEENEFKNKEEEIQNNLKDEEMQRKKIEEVIKKKLENEEILNKLKQEEINNQLNNEELLRKKIEDQNYQEILNEENLKKKLEEKNNEESEDDLELKKIEEDLGINNIEKDQKEKKSIKDDKNNEEIAYKNTNFIESLKEDPKIGLNNIGATCYMNATIQCFSRTTELSNYFLNPENIFTQDKKLSFSYLNLITNLWHKQNNNAKSYSPYDFKNVISEMNPLFQGIAANDSKDLILFILQQLHEELKIKMEENTLINQYKEIADQTNRNAVLEEFKESMKNNVSIISELYFGMNEIISDCLNCRQKGNQVIKYNFQIFNFIIFPLKEVSNYKKAKLDNLNNNININDDSVTIYDCFEQFIQPTIMTGDNMMFCNYCQQLANTSYTTKIFSTPKILILILNRGKGNEFNIKINFDKIISIGKYVEQKEKEELNYELYGVLTHLGTSDMSGHFVSFCYSIIDKIWYKFNDAFVDPVYDFQKDIHDFEDPYILFYRKMN